MKLDWFWIELGFHPDMPLPVMTMALIRAARYRGKFPGKGGVKDSKV